LLDFYDINFIQHTLIQSEITLWCMPLIVGQSDRPSVFVSVCPPVRLPVCLSVCLSVCQSVRPSVRLSVCLSVCIILCIFRSWTINGYLPDGLSVRIVY